MGLAGVKSNRDCESYSCLEGVIFLTGVKVRDDESFEKALRRFNKFCEKTGILSDIKKHQRFEKPSDRRKRKLNAAKRRVRRLIRLRGE